MPIILGKKPSTDAAANLPAPPAPAPAAGTPPRTAAPRQQPQSPPPVQPQRPRGLGGGRGLPPAPTDVDTSRPRGGGFEKRDSEYWLRNRLRAGEHTFRVCYVNKIVAWSGGDMVVSLRVSDWDNAANQPRENHGRPIDWYQQPHEKLLARLHSADEKDAKAARESYAWWRSDLAACYAGCGYPDESWPLDDDGNAEAPWHAFFVREVGGLMVPVCLTVGVSVTPPSNKGTGFTNVRSMSLLLDAQGNPVQAPLPYEVPPALAEHHGWRGVQKWIGRDKDTESFELDRSQIEEGHAGLTTWKDV